MTSYRTSSTRERSTTTLWADSLSKCGKNFSQNELLYFNELDFIERFLLAWLTVNHMKVYFLTKILCDLCCFYRHKKQICKFIVLEKSVLFYTILYVYLL